MKKENHLLESGKDRKLNSRVGKVYTVLQFEKIFKDNTTRLEMKIV